MQYPTLSEEQLQTLKEAGIEPLALFFYPPGFQPPKLLDPNYVPSTRKDIVLGLSILTAVVTTIFAGLKLIARKFILYQFGWEDVVLFWAWAFCVGTCALNIWSVTDTCMGYHLYDCSFQEIQGTYKFQYAMWIISTLAVGITRGAILIFLWNLTPVTKVIIRRIIIFLHLVNIGSWCLLIFPIVFQCYPKMNLWDMQTTLLCINPDGYVIGKLAIAAAALAAALDFSLLLLPTGLVFGLNASLRKRLAISSIFGIGFLACLASVLRAYFIGVHFSQINYVDFSWEIIPAICAFYVEAIFGMITACIPSIKAAHGTLTNKTPYSNSNNHPRARESLNTNLTLGSRRTPKMMSIHEADPDCDGGSAERCSISGQSRDAHDLDLHSGTSTLHLNPQMGHESDVQLQDLRPAGSGG